MTKESEENVPKNSIEILKGYRMVGEGKQWALYRLQKVVSRDNPQDHKMDWKVLGFYCNLTQVFERITDEELKSSKSMEEILKKLRELQEYFKKKLEVEWDA